MGNATRILIVEDDMIIAANLSLQLTNLGYEIVGIETRGEEALEHARLNTPDIILMDINLRGALDGIETVKAIQEYIDVPIIYLTANSDETTFMNARSTRPHAFISKPFNPVDLQRTVALVAEQISKNDTTKSPVQAEMSVMNDRIFVRHNGQMLKLLLEDILYIEADRNYCHIVTHQNKILVVSTLKSIESELPPAHFIRVHRSYVVNLSKLDVVADGHLEIGRKVIPVSRSYKEYLMSRLHTI
ncbi:MAG: LytR/AlgR family response regulator transcription factor [Flavobacteriaceae bacterium]